MAFMAVRQFLPEPVDLGALTSTSAIDATGEKLAFIGRVWNKDRTSKNIQTVGLRFGSVTKAGGSALTLSLQDVNAAAGPPYQPDGTQDQTYAIANANASWVSNTWMQSGNLSATRTVAFGELVAVVLEYDGAGRLGADTTQLGGRTTNVFDLSSGGAQYVTGAWVASSLAPNVLFGFDDGTFGTFEYAFPGSAITNVAINTGSTGTGGDESALEFTVPFRCKIDGGWVLANPASGADFDVVLYDGTTSLASASFDANSFRDVGTARPLRVPLAEQTLVPGSTYRLAIKPTTANNVTIYYHEVSHVDHWQAHGHTEFGFKWTKRVDAGSWDAPTTTRRLFAGIRLSGIEYGVQPTFVLGI